MFCTSGEPFLPGARQPHRQCKSAAYSVQRLPEEGEVFCFAFQSGDPNFRVLWAALAAYQEPQGCP